MKIRVQLFGDESAEAPILSNEIVFPAMGAVSKEVMGHIYGQIVAKLQFDSDVIRLLRQQGGATHH